MSDAIARPPRRNPQRRTVQPTLPPAMRSRKALGFGVAAGEGRFCLQVCAACGRVSYPAREACPGCLSMDLRWQDAPTGGRLVAETTIRASTNVYFRERTPWRVGTVMLDAGISVLAHVHGDVAPLGRVRMIARTDKSGQGVMMALPEVESENMNDDKQLRELTCDPKHRRVLITDARAPSGAALVRAMQEAGAGAVFVGLAEDWRGFDGMADLRGMANVEIVPLDITDTRSVQECVGEIGGKVDIVINNMHHTRPGGIMGRRDVVTSQDEMQVNYFGLLRLMQGFGPGMKARGADGVNSACAWVNLLSVYALSNRPDFGSSSASQAAALSLAQCFRAEMAGSGVKVVNAFHGPLEDEWHQPLPPPKVSPGRLARAVCQALQQGLEDIAIGEVARDVRARWQQDAGVLEKELTRIEGV